MVIQWRSLITSGSFDTSVIAIHSEELQPSILFPQTRRTEGLQASAALLTLSSFETEKLPDK